MAEAQQVSNVTRAKPAPHPRPPSCSSPYLSCFSYGEISSFHLSHGFGPTSWEFLEIIFSLKSYIPPVSHAFKAWLESDLTTWSGPSAFLWIILSLLPGLQGSGLATTLWFLFVPFLEILHGASLSLVRPARLFMICTPPFSALTSSTAPPPTH